jgi:hypothetical protein
MLIEEYQRICARLARKAIRFAKELSVNDMFPNKGTSCPKCKQPPGEDCSFTNSGHAAPEGFIHNERASAALEARHMRWIDVFLDEHLPDIDTDVLFEVACRANTIEKIASLPALSRGFVAVRVFQADVRAAINRIR